MCRILWWVIRSHLIFKYSWLLCLEEKKKSSFHLCSMAFPTRALLSLLKLYLINVLVILNISTAAGAFVIIEVSGRVSHRWELLTGGIEVRAAGRVPPLPSARRTCVIDDNVCVDLHLQEPHRFITMSPQHNTAYRTRQRTLLCFPIYSGNAMRVSKGFGALIQGEHF